MVTVSSGPKVPGRVLVVVLATIMLFAVLVSASPAHADVTAPTQPAATQTAVACDPSSVEVGTSTACTATVTGESSVAGQTVSWGSTGTGTFDSIDCTLVASPDASSDTCSVTYTPTKVGSGVHTITANYVGDAAHLDSTDNFDLVVTGGTSSATTTTTTTSITTTTTTSSTSTTSGVATVWTDKLDYSPGETPTIYGSGFEASADITVSVTRPEGTTNSWVVGSDDSGGFTTSYGMDLVEGTFIVTATDGTNTATITFTDKATKTLAISYQVIGGGTPTNPTLHYTLSGSSLTVAVPPSPGATNVQADPGSNYWVGPNPLTGPGSTERWYSSDGCDSASNTCGVGSDVTKTYNYYHQWQVSFAVSPTGGGSVTVNGTAPVNPSWYDDGPAQNIVATLNSGYVFSSWSVSTTSGTITIANPSLASTAATIRGTGTITANFNLADTTPPTTTASLTANASPYTSGTWTKYDVEVSLTAIDTGGSGVKQITYSASGAQTIDPTTVSGSTASFSITAEGTTTVSFYATDNANNVETPAKTVTIKIDKTAPAVTVTPDRSADSGDWYNHILSFIVTGTSTTSGAATCDAIPNYSSPDGASVSVSATCVNPAGNRASGSFSFKYDGTAPTITISSPVNGAQYVLNAAVPSDYECSDTISGMQSCSGTVVNGLNFDTSSVGAHSFNVSATDRAGNTATPVKVTYNVIYSQSKGRTVLSPLEQVDNSSRLKKSHQTGSTIPIKFQLFDSKGVPIGTAKPTLQILDANGKPVPVKASGSSNVGNVFRYDPTEQQYIYNLSTKGLSPGVYKIVITLNDGTTIVTYFRLK